MKKILMILMLALFCVPWVTNAQVTIGAGTATNSYLPSYSYYNYSISQQIYTAEEISASGTITSIAFYNGGAEKSRQYDIYMAHTTKSAFESTADWIALSDADIVYNGTEAVTMTANAWTTFNLNTPFAYNGTDNLVVCVIDRTGDYSSSPHMSCRVFNTTEYQALYCYNDDYDALSPDGTNDGEALSYSLGRPQVKNQIILGGIQQAYPTPTDLATSGITATAATLNWTENGTATSWEVAYKAASDADFTTVTTSTKPYTIEGLTPQTAYTAKVRSYYSSTIQSGWVETSFTTNELCPDGMVCIGTGTATNSYIPTYSYYNYSLTQQIYTADEINATGSILSVDFHSSGALTRTLDIYMVNTTKSSFEGNTDWIPVTASDLVFSGSVTFAAGDWTTIELTNPFAYDGESNLAIIVDDNTGSYVGSPSFYAFSATSQAIRIYSDGTNYDPTNPSSYTGSILTQKNRIRLGIGEPPTCPKPTNLVVSNVTNHGATLNWTDNADAEAWYIYVNGDFYADVAETPQYTFTGLDPETQYKVKVSAMCADEEESELSIEVQFTTAVACAAPTDVEVSDVEPFSATVSWNGNASKYNLRYRAARGFNYGFETAEGFVVDQFPPCTTYDGDGLTTYGISGYTMPNNTANYIGSVVSFNEYWTAHSGNTMGVFMDAIPSTSGGATANDDYFITPALTIAAGDHFQFWARSVTNSYGLERMKVGIYGGDGTISTYLAGSADTYVEVPVDWTKYDYDLTAYAGQTIELAINCVSADAFALLFDDLFVGDPTDDTWDVTLNNVTSPYTLTGLNDETTYEVQLQADCGHEDGVSEWVGTNFMTPSNCSTPTQLAADSITPSAATLSWEAFQDTYNVQYRTAESRETYYFNDFNDEQTEGWTRDYFIYGFTDPIYNVSGDDNYFLEMGWNSTEEETIITCELPEYPSGAHVEFYYFGYQTDNTFQVGFSTTTNDADAFTWSDPIDAPLSTYTLYNEELAAGVKYFAWKATASAQAAAIFIDDFGIFGETIPAGAWQTANAVTSPYTLEGLAGNTEYEWQVQGVNPSCDGGVTEWSHMGSFTTPDACQTPVIEDVDNVEATTATVYWTGVQESYNVRYGVFEEESFINFDDEVIPAEWTNVSTHPWALTDTLTESGFCIRSTNSGFSSDTSSISFTATYEAEGVISFDAMFMGEGTSTAYDKCIFSIDGNQKFAYGQIGEEWYNMAYVFAAGEHTFTWTYIKDSSVDPTGDFFAIDNIKIQLHGDTWTTVEGVEGDSYDMTDLTPNSVVAVQVQGNNTECDEGVTAWSSEYLFITDEATECMVVLDETEGFETYTNSEEYWTGAFPECWTIAHHYKTGPDTVAMIYRYFATEEDGHYTLRMQHRGIVAMPALPEDVDFSRLQLNMQVRQSKSYYMLEVGVMTDLEGEESFIPVALCDNGSSTGMEPFKCTFANYTVPEGYTGPFYVAFRNIGTSSNDSHSVNYLDEVELSYLDEAEECAITALEYPEDFEDIAIAEDGRLVPACWTLPDAYSNIPTKYKPQLYKGFATTGIYSLRMRDLCTYVMPEYAVANTPIQNAKMTFSLRQPNRNYRLEVGVMTDANDTSTFVLVKRINNQTQDIENVEVSFANYVTPADAENLYIAFRNVGYSAAWTYSYNYIDSLRIIEVADNEEEGKIAEAEGDNVFDSDRYLENITVYPNPTTGNLYIDAVDVQKVEVFNQMGQLVGVYGSEQTIDLGSLTTGVYMIHITVPQGTTVRKVVKR